MLVKITQIAPEDTWHLRHSVMWPDKPASYVKLEEDKQGTHYGLWQGEELIGVVSLFYENGKAQFRKLAVKVSEQGKGYGSKLLAHLMQEVTYLNTSQNQNIESIWCNARSDKTTFYKKFGMLETEKTFNKGGIDYVIMEKELK